VVVTGEWTTIVSGEVERKVYVLWRKSEACRFWCVHLICACCWLQGLHCL